MILHRRNMASTENSFCRSIVHHVIKTAFLSWAREWEIGGERESEWRWLSLEVRELSFFDLQQILFFSFLFLTFSLSSRDEQTRWLFQAWRAKQLCWSSKTRNAWCLHSLSADFMLIDRELLLGITSLILCQCILPVPWVDNLISIKPVKAALSVMTPMI